MNKISYSIIVTTYNRPKELRCCIKRILEQTFNNFELLIIDDGSVLDNRVVINDFLMKDNYRVKYFRLEHKGLAFARNFGIRKSKNKFIFLVVVVDFFWKKIV